MINLDDVSVCEMCEGLLLLRHLGDPLASTPQYNKLLRKTLRYVKFADVLERMYAMPCYEVEYE